MCYWLAKPGDGDAAEELSGLYLRCLTLGFSDGAADANDGPLLTERAGEMQGARAMAEAYATRPPCRPATIAANRR